MNARIRSDEMIVAEVHCPFETGIEAVIDAPKLTVQSVGIEIVISCVVVKINRGRCVRQATSDKITIHRVFDIPFDVVEDIPGGAARFHPDRDSYIQIVENVVIKVLSDSVDRAGIRIARRIVRVPEIAVRPC